MNDPLVPLLADGVVEEVVGRLKSGKEAELWLVRHAGEIVAAKVYKDRQARSFRNDAAYREGRLVRDTRTQRAMARGTRFGQAAAEDAWKAKEADALHALHAAGVRVPRPVIFYEGVLLMELVVDAEGRPAQRLIDAHVPRSAAAALYADLRAQVVAMLCCDVVHGDLSPYNVLLGRSGPVIIDFPQVVGAAHNSQAETFFRRDLENLRRFFAQHDPAVHAAATDAREIWRAYVRRELTPEFVPEPRHAAAPVAPDAHRLPATSAPRRGPETARTRDRQQRPTAHRGRGHPARAGGRAARDQRYPEVVRVVRDLATDRRAQPDPHTVARAAASHPPVEPGERRDAERRDAQAIGQPQRRRRRRRRHRPS